MKCIWDATDLRGFLLHPSEVLGLYEKSLCVVFKSIRCVENILYLEIGFWRFD